MEVKSTTSGYVQGYTAVQEKNKAAEAKETRKEIKNDEAAEFIRSENTEKKATYDKVSKLTDKQIEGLKEEQQAAKIEMLKKMLEANVKNQAISYGMSEKSQNLIKEIFGSIEEGIPPLATSPEEAKKAIEEGGVYSVDAVASRIMKMAKSLAGDNKEAIGKLRDAVEKGFEAAGLDFKDMTGGALPQICKDTFDEVMKRFDEWEKEDIEA
jgi:hypothetical protein